MSYFRENIEKAKGYTPGFQPKDKTVVKLNTNENPYPPSKNVLRAIADIQPEQLRRYPDPLGDDFRKAAAKVLEVDPDYIMCCNGGDDLLRIAFEAFCDAERPVAYPIPTYTLYPVLANIQGCNDIEVPFDNEFNLPSRLSGTGAALTIVCNPNAPTATMVRTEELASLADELSGVLLIDEAYVDFAEFNALELVKNFDNVIILRSMSKGYSLAGIRFGYSVAKPAMIDGLMKVKDSYNVDTVAIAAATAAMEDQSYFRQNVDKIKNERARITKELRQLDFSVITSQTNFVLAEPKSFKARVIYDKLIENNIYVRFFDVPGLDSKLRVTIGTQEQNDRLIKTLKQILK